jgi:uncharacterized membrane protein
MSSFTDTTLETLVSRTLRIGVYVSGSFMVAGFIVSLFHPELLSQELTHVSYGEILQLLHPNKNFVSRILDPFLLFYLGILVLMLTPVFRVVIVVVSFSLERDKRFVLISLGVLVILLISFYLSSR